jgi:pimeloyl-ACP methyl ester carboxylesterase
LRISQQFCTRITYSEGVKRSLSPTIVVFIALGLAATACSGSSNIEVVGQDTTVANTDTTNSPSTVVSNGIYSTAGFSTPTISWDSCGAGLECGYVDVPIDYSDVNSPTTSLYVVKHPATGTRIGSLLVNPGGPGFGGSYLAESAVNIYSPAILDSFDIIGWDPRGTGQSIPAIDCTDDYDYFFASGDITPDTEQERADIVASAEEFTQACFDNNGDLLPYIGTNNVARDMDMIRRALGEDKISYFGFSYGSELGAAWVTMFPDTVRAAVLDGASDPNADDLTGTLQQNKGFEESITTFLAKCSDDSACAFSNGGNAEDAFDELMAELDENPIPTSAGRPDLTRGMALTAVAQAMYSDSYWSFLENALAAAQAGDGSDLLSLYDDYFQRQPDGTYGNELEAFVNILCADSPDRITVEEADARVPQYQANAPRFSPGTTGDYTCTFWPKALDPRIKITGKGAGPIVVIGTTGDAATPLASTRNMVKALEEGRLIVVTAEQHTGYNVNSCVNDAVDSYLIDLQAPDNELDC